MAGLSQQQQAAARQAASTRFTGGIGTVGTARAATAAELRGGRGGVSRMEAEATKAQISSMREATKARQDLEKAQRSSDRAAKDEQRTVIAGQRAWDAMAITLGGNQRVLAQTRRAKDQLRASVASGAITQDKANAALKRAITHYRELSVRAKSWHDELKLGARLLAAQAVATAVPGLGGFALGGAIGARGIAAAAAVSTAVGAGLATVKFAKSADEIRMLQAQLTAFSGSADKATIAYEGLLATSRETDTALQSNAVLLRRLTQSQQDLGASTEEIIRFQEIVQKLMIASGTATTEAQAGTLQLS